MGILSFSPSDFQSDTFDDRSLKFFQTLISSYGFGGVTARVNVTPFCSSFITAAVASAQDFYYDLSQLSGAGYTSGQLTNKVFYVGSLNVIPTVEIVGAPPGDYLVSLYTSWAIQPNFIFERRAIAAVDTAYGLDRLYQFDQVGFSYIRIAVTGTGSGVSMRATFSGVKISL